MSPGEDSGKADELKFIKNQRKFYRSKATRLCNSLNLDYVNSLTLQDRDKLKISLKEVKDKLDKLNDEASRVMWKCVNSEEVLEAEFADRDAYDDKISEGIRAIENSARPADRSHFSSSEHGEMYDRPVSVSNQLKLPQIPLPEFSNPKKESLETFLCSFESIVEKYNLNQFEKYVFLERQLKNEPLILIKSLGTNQKSYDAAKDLLISAFASPINLKFDIIERLVKLKLGYPGEPYRFISEMRIIEDTFRELKIDTDTVIQYFIWNSFNDQFRNVMISVTNETKPSLDTIRENIFKVTERYLSSAPVSGNSSNPNFSHKIDPNLNRNSLSSMAVNVENQFERHGPSRQSSGTAFISCVLCKFDNCSDPNHPLFKCSNYSSAVTKVRKLIAINGCIKCGNDNHRTSDCKYKFKRPCKNCKKFHFDYLCENLQPTERRERIINSSINVNHASFLPFEQCKKVILPTFSCELPNGHCLRALKDSGAQFSFVTKEISDRYKFKKVFRKVSLDILGFNSNQYMITDVVQFKAVFNDKTHCIMAIVVPSISTSMVIPGLCNLSLEFEKRGFILADKFLTHGGDIIDDINFILGANANYCLPETTVVYGEKFKSSYIETPIGIMLNGTIEYLKVNMKFLPFDSKVQCEFTGDISFLNVNHVVLNNAGKLIQSKLDKALNDAVVDGICPYLDDKCRQILEYGETTNEVSTNESSELVSYVISNTSRMKDGRLVMPLTWNENVKHLLGQNYSLSKQILLSNLRKYKNDQDKLLMIDDSFREHLKLGVIEKIPNLDNFLLEHPEACFLAHMPVFKLNKETTKCRNVYLSNLAGRDPNKTVTLSNNQCVKSGPTVNHKISTSFILMRFDKYLLCFDLVKAFLQISLKDSDSLKLCFLWFRDVKSKDFTIECYKNVRLPFGLKCSPFILMMSLYKILIIDAKDDNSDVRDLKKQIWANFYMDNGAITGSREYIAWAYNLLNDIFNQYKFSIQQVYSNCIDVQNCSDLKSEANTPDSVKLLGINWNRISDEICTEPMRLNIDAKTKREVLRSLASNYDAYNVCAPMLNRAKLFMHKLQCNPDLDWDTTLPSEILTVWKNICKQINSSPTIPIKRSVGNRSDTYNLVAFVDSSGAMVGVVLYLYNVTNSENSFLLARNKVVGKDLADKTIPSLELTSINLGAETLVDTYKELTGDAAVLPIKISRCFIFSDSLVCLNWLNLYTVKMDKMRNKTVYVMNRLDSIVKFCNTVPITFKFCNGLKNPSDCMTREFSYKLLLKSNFHTGPDFLQTVGPEVETVMSLTVPNPNYSGDFRHTSACEEHQPGSPLSPAGLKVSSEHADRSTAALPCEKEDSMGLLSHHTLVEDISSAGLGDSTDVASPDKVSSAADQSSVSIQADALNTGVRSDLIDYHNYSSYLKMLNVTFYVLKFINRISKSPNLACEEIKAKAFNHLIRSEQMACFSDIFDYFTERSVVLKKIPPLVMQLNLFMDDDGILRVKSKFGRFRSKNYFPILLSKSGYISGKIVCHYHEVLSHSNVYAVMNELRKKFYVCSVFSTVKKCIKNCITCRKQNNRPVKLNQSSYRDFRVNPPTIPFRTLFLDYIGPFWVKSGNCKMKVYLLCFTCLWSRAINLILCRDLTVTTFMRAFQIHCFSYGVPEKCHSDLGSQIVAGANVISDFISDDSSRGYFLEKGINPLTFVQFPKGCKELGGLVETSVKAVKKLIYSSIGKNILCYDDFDFLVSQTIHLVNKRPIALKEVLRDDSCNVPNPITPEMVIRGYELHSLNLIPDLQSIPKDSDWSQCDPVGNVIHSYSKLAKVRTALIKYYGDQFLTNLIDQAVGKPGRFKPVLHHEVSVGDIVLVKEENTKSINFPMAIVREVNRNYLGEITDVVLFKGATREIIKRHITTVIPLLSKADVPSDPVVPDGSPPDEGDPVNCNRTRRAAAERSAVRTAELYAQQMA